LHIRASLLAWAANGFAVQAGTRPHTGVEINEPVLAQNGSDRKLPQARVR
jgi:hypothetical protein